jgi:hypothetical protein
VSQPIEKSVFLSFHILIDIANFDLENSGWDNDERSALSAVTQSHPSKSSKSGCFFAILRMADLPIKANSCMKGILD